MKKFISLKTFPLLIAVATLMTLGACRQDDENDFQQAKTSAISNKTIHNTQSKPNNGEELKEADPPVKNGTHWKTQQ
ncbi:hypothetical protein CEY12_18820 [Chryseobacterium sp. T16E-39]|uniref:hypothetical protein n=1 Tax=Chryseobacterium sp. T16E-39 TaxID=2015076 RepID=UPI000B5B1980|nr:hypothetical protein [Chryseobacterium sp. T16E-39]ASK32026.1 hypothetical protein CEY12_18820 [Chryseobacterium sp. T16E-39]